MPTIATTIRITDSLQERYDQLARATGRTRNYLMAEALERYAARVRMADPANARIAGRA